MKRGFTLIELLAVIVILGIITAITVPIVQKNISSSKEKLYNVAVGNIIDGAKQFVSENYDFSENLQNIGYAYAPLSILTSGGYLDEGIKNPETGEDFSDDAVVKITVPTTGNYIYEFFEDLSSVPANAPTLVAGMIAVKWDGSSWIKVANPSTDISWFSYDTTTKMWANAVTVTPATKSVYQAAANGSVINMSDIYTMWVWIPRFTYKISSGWHSSTTGTMDVKFSIGADDTRGGTVTLDTGTTSNASNNKYTSEPAFTFGAIQLTGIWVAKFEASAPTSSVCYTSPSSTNCNVANLALSSIPGVQSWRYITTGNMFTVSRSMETNSTYGWGTSGTNVDTHLMKNTEWGTVAYLSKSIYGQNTNEIWINPADNYATGCSGTSATSGSTAGCTNNYASTNGVKASTTGNVYGIYDISGGSWECLAAYLNNGNSSLNTYGSVMVSAASQYKDIYTVGSTDDQAINYGLTINKKGDAIYETSNNISGPYSWFSDYSYMPNTNSPWIVRGGYFGGSSGAGAFYFSNTNGSAGNFYGFRPVLLVNSGL